MIIATTHQEMVGILIVVSGSLGGGHVSGDLLALHAITAFAANLNIWRRFPDMSRTAAIGLAGAFIATAALVPAGTSRPRRSA